jgi:hypothetical protein
MRRFFYAIFRDTLVSNESRDQVGYPKSRDLRSLYISGSGTSRTRKHHDARPREEFTDNQYRLPHKRSHNRITTASSHLQIWHHMNM